MGSEMCIRDRRERCTLSGLIGREQRANQHVGSASWVHRVRDLRLRVAWGRGGSCLGQHPPALRNTVLEAHTVHRAPSAPKTREPMQTISGLACGVQPLPKAASSHALALRHDNSTTTPPRPTLARFVPLVRKSAGLRGVPDGVARVRRRVSPSVAGGQRRWRGGRLADDNRVWGRVFCAAGAHYRRVSFGLTLLRAPR